MKYFRFIIIFICISIVSGCATKNCMPDKLKTGYSLLGTNTAVVGIMIDSNGTPKETFKDIVVYPGQKVLYAGPDTFSIVFKNRKTPNGKVENMSARGVVVIQIPENIFEQKQYLKEIREKDEIVFDYSIKVDGKELDPPLIVRRGG